MPQNAETVLDGKQGVRPVEQAAGRGSPLSVDQHHDLGRGQLVGELTPIGENDRLRRFFEPQRMGQYDRLGVDGDREITLQPKISRRRSRGFRFEASSEEFVSRPRGSLNGNGSAEERKQRWEYDC